jgi:hypothetical protein
MVGPSSIRARPCRIVMRKRHGVRYVQTDLAA